MKIVDSSIDLHGRKRPDTFDLAERAELGLNYLINVTDPEQHHRPYFENQMLPEPLIRHHRWDIIDCCSRFIQALIFARLMTGRDEGREMEAALKKYLLSSFENGTGEVCYLPADDGWYAEYDKPYFLMWDQSRALLTLVTWYLAAESDDDRNQAEAYFYKLMNGLKSFAVFEGDTAYYAGDLWYAGRWKTTVLGGECPGGQLIDALARFYAGTGDSRVLDFASKLANGVLANKGMSYKGFFEGGHFESHFHGYSSTVAGMVRLGLATGNSDLVEWGRDVYTWIMSGPDNLNRGSSFGWFPEHVTNLENDGSSKVDSETCCTADMIEIAALLASAGYPQYWGDVERFVRNYVAEMQITSLERFEPFWAKFGTDGKGQMDSARRMVGGFVACAYPNDLYMDAKGWGLDGRYVNMMGCCPPAGVNALYYAWSSVLTKDGDTLRVNLALNRQSKWAEVVSSLPYKGNVTVLVREASSVHVRVPEWVEVESVCASVNDKPVNIRFKDGYAVFDGTEPGDSLSLTFPVRQGITRESAGGSDLSVALSKGQQEYEIAWRGDTVVGISPKGKNLPLYERAWMDTDEVPFRSKSSRPLPSEELKW